MGMCERCKKAQATFHLTNVDRSGAKSERHLCDRCATEEGLLQSPKVAADLDALMQSFIAGSKASGEEVSQLVCDECGISYVEFRNQGLLGCPHDYEAFKEQLGRLIERTHGGSTAHVGKAPRSMGLQRKPTDDVRRLRRQLEDAVAAEDYERAAKLRDRIRELEGA